MVVTKENISTLELHQQVWVPKSFRIPERYVYLGLISTALGSYHVFTEPTGGEGFGILSTHPEGDDDLRNGNIFTTYEECCEKLRVQCLNTIDHFNRHQLKNNPIPISEEDQKFLYKYK